MDPVCHTLVGAALAESGLKRRTTLGTATLVIGANLPDIDVLSYVGGDTFALSFRRGLTHGVLALIVLPFILTGIMLAWDRWVRLRRQPDAGPAMGPQLLLLSTIAILTHPALDFLNTYGMRWLSPFSNRWFYADTLFIVDPWVWAGLTAGVLTARREGPALARWSLGAFGAYISVMAVIGLAGRGAVTRDLASRGMSAPTSLMVAPVPVTPLRRAFVAEVDGRFRLGTVRYLPLRVELDVASVERHPATADAAGVNEVEEAAWFLSWARFPFSYVEIDDDGVVIELGDARYTLDPARSWAGVVVRR